MKRNPTGLLPEPTRNWFWKRKNWLSVPQISPHLCELSDQIMAKEDALDRLTGNTRLAPLMAEALAKDIQGSWALEGIPLDSYALRSSIVKHLGLDVPEWRKLSLYRSVQEDTAVKATIHLLHSKFPLSIDTILQAHAQLKPVQTDTVWGIFRNDVEYIVDGDENHKEIIYVAPHPSEVPQLMDKYVDFWHCECQELPRPLGAALVHLYFVVIHPFEDGNGRMARMLSEKFLAEKSGHTFRPYSMISMIQENRHAYARRLDTLDTDDGLHHFLFFALSMHSLALDKALQRATILQRIDEVFEKCQGISEEQKYIIRTMSMEPEKHWYWQEVLFAMEDDETASDAWNDLVERGCIAEGKILLAVVQKSFSSKRRAPTG